MIICPNCGAEYDELLSSACPSCGAELPVECPAAETDPDTVVSDEIVLAVTEEIRAGQRAAKKKKLRKTLLTVLAILVLAAAVIAVCIFTSPAYRLSKAAVNTVNQLALYDDGCDNAASFSDAMAAYAKFGKSKKSDFTINASGEVDPLKTISEEDLEALRSLGELPEELLNKVTIGSQADLHYEYDSDSKTVRGLFNAVITQNGEETPAKLDLYMNDQQLSIPANIEFSINEDQIMLSAPKLLKDVYSVNCKTFGNDFVGSQLYKRSGLDRLDIPKEVFEDIELYPFGYDEAEYESSVDKQIMNVVRGYLRSVKIEKTSEIINSFGGDVYRVVYDGVALKQMLRNCLDIIDETGAIQNNAVNIIDADGTVKHISVKDILKAVRNADVQLLLGVKNKMLTAVSVSINGSPVYSFVLSGENNVFESFALFEDTETLIDGGIIAATDFRGFVEHINYKGEELVSLVFNDDKGEIEIVSPILRSVISFAEKDGKVELGSDIELILDELGTPLQSMSVDLSYTCAPLDRAPDMLSSNAVDFFGMSAREFNRMVDELLDSLFTDPDYAWMFEPESGDLGTA